MDTLPSGQWTKQQLFVQVCYPNPARVANQPFGESTFTGQKQSGIHRSHQWLGCCQGDSPMGVEHETFQKPKARESHPPDNHKSITHALAQFGTPCAHAQHASRTNHVALLSASREASSTSVVDELHTSVNNPSTDRPSNWKHAAYHNEFNHCVPQRKALGKMPYTEKVQNAPEGDPVIQELGKQFHASPSMVYSRQNTEAPNPYDVPVLLSTSPLGPDAHQTSLQTPSAKSEYEAARVRRSTNALVGTTTLVVRNIPARYSQQDILKHVWVPDGTFDLLFVPHSFKLGHTVGYGFINFTSPAYAQAFHHRWHGQRLPGGRKAKPLNISAARFQGIYDNMNYLSTSEVMRVKDTKFQPSVFHGACRINFMDALQASGLAESEKRTACEP